MMIDQKMAYPPYYRRVFVKYQRLDNKQYHIDILWLAVDDDNRRVWTFNNDCDTILDKDFKLINWWYINDI